MIQEFSVQNFLSFKEKQTISFVATADKTLAEELIFEPKKGVRLLRMAMVYGANASGKSNLLRAIKTLWEILFYPQVKEHEAVSAYQPFELSKGKPSSFDITFWANGRRYKYEVEYNSSSILYEKMMYSSDKDVLSLMYERKKGEHIQFGSTLGIKVKQRDELNLETLSNHTVLSTLNKKNVEVPDVMRELYEWIKRNTQGLGFYSNGSFIAEQAVSNPKLKKLILELLHKADFNIADFSLVDVSMWWRAPVSKNDVPKRNPDHSEKQLLFTHRADDGNFSIITSKESAGTRTYLRLACLLFELKKGGYVLMEDELDSSLHYDLQLHYLQTYLEASGNSQLIFTTHNQLLLDEDWMIRRDMIWFTEKDRTSSTTALSRASDFGIHKNVSLLNAYRIGKLGAKPVLGSTLLNTEGV